MKKTKLITCVVVGLVVSLHTSDFLFASSCHGGHTGGQRSELEEHQTKEKKKSPPIKFIEIKSPPKMTVQGTLTCPGDYLDKNRKGSWHEDEKCKNSAILIEKVVECPKSGKKDCPYESKLYHILLNKDSKKLVNNKKYRDAKVSITGRFYIDERILKVISFRLLK